MTRRLSDSIFQGRGTDGMVVDDAYQISTGETRNSVYESAKGIFSDAIKGLQTNKQSIGELTRLVLDSKNGTVNKGEMFSRALGALGTSLPGLLGTLGGTLKNKIGGAAGELIGPDAQKAVEVLYNNVPTLLSTTNVKDSEDLISLIQELTGNSELAGLINIEAESAVIAGIAGTLLDYDIPNLLDDVLDMSRSDTVRYNAMAYISTRAVAGADLDTVNKIIDTIGLSMFLENNPNAIKDIVGSFYLGSEETPDQWPAKRDKMITLLNRIDAHWFEYNRNGEWVINLQTFSWSSGDTKKLFLLDLPWRTYQLASTGWQAQNVSAVEKELYPNAWITG